MFATIAGDLPVVNELLRIGANVNMIAQQVCLHYANGIQQTCCVFKSW